MRKKHKKFGLPAVIFEADVIFQGREGPRCLRLVVYDTDRNVRWHNAEVQPVVDGKPDAMKRTPGTVYGLGEDRYLTFAARVLCSEGGSKSVYRTLDTIRINPKTLNAEVYSIESAIKLYQAYKSGLPKHEHDAMADKLQLPAEVIIRRGEELLIRNAAGTGRKPENTVFASM